ncbi:MAG: DedD protein [Betaproteobacteria bacterium]
MRPRRRHGMARPISDEELQLKKRARRRLVGAIVLVSAVAVILPMVLDSEPKAVNQNVDIQIPPTDSPDRAKIVTPGLVIADADKGKGSPPSAKQTEPRAASTTEADSASVSRSIEAEPKGDTASSARPVKPSGAAAGPSEPGSPGAVLTKEITQNEATRKQSVADDAREGSRAPAGEPPKAATKEPSTAANAAYVVQVAALSDSIRVKQLQKQIAGAGVKAYTEVVSTKSGHVTRVRAGPYATREAAEKARTQLKKVGLEGKVVPR